jgi:CRISPR-associated protein Csm1
MAALSRQMNAFFAVWLPAYCKEKYPNSYTVFGRNDNSRQKQRRSPWQSRGLFRLLRRCQWLSRRMDCHVATLLAMTRVDMSLIELICYSQRFLK